MKASFILVLLLVAFSCGGNEKRIRRRLQKKIAQQIEEPSEFPEFQVNFQKGKSWGDVTTEEKFYAMFPNLPRLPQHKKGDNGVWKPRRQGQGQGILLGSKVRPLGNRGPQGSTNNADQVDTTTHCASRRTLIGLPIKQVFGQRIFPSCTWVNRCTGCMCPSPELTCKPVKERKKTVYFYRIDGATAKQDKIVIKEHVTCSCQCIKLPSSCNGTTQTWVADKCDCDCKPEYQRHNMNCQRPFTYDRRKCGCVCPKVKEDCPHGMVWSFADCRCVLTRRHDFLFTKKRLPVVVQRPISVVQKSEDTR